MNEPHPGYINLESLHSFNYNTDLHLSYIRKYPMSNCTAHETESVLVFSVCF